MKSFFRNALAILAILMLVVGTIIFFRPYISRLIFSWRSDPFTIVRKTLKDDPSIAVRGEAALTLVSIDRARAVPYLIDSLKTDSDIRLSVISALIRAGKPSVPPLLEFAKNDLDINSEEDVKLLTMILGAIREIDVSNTIVKTNDDKKYLIDVINNKTLSSDARVIAISLLGKITADDLEKIHSSLDDPDLKIKVINMVGNGNDVNLISSLIEYFYYDQDSDVRQNTLAVMGKLLDQEQQVEQSNTNENKTIEVAPTNSP